MLIILHPAMEASKAYNRQETIQFFTQKIRDREIELPMVRKSLTQMGLEEEEIKRVVWKVDDIISKEAVRRVNRRLGREMYYAGVLIASSGFIAALLSFGLSAGAYIVIAFGSSGAGVVMAIAGKERMKK